LLAQCRQAVRPGLMLPSCSALVVPSRARERRRWDFRMGPGFPPGLDPGVAHPGYSSGRRRVTREDEVAIFGRLVAGEAGLVQGLVARLPVLKSGESPAATRAVLF